MRWLVVLVLVLTLVVAACSTTGVPASTPTPVEPSLSASPMPVESASQFAEPSPKPTAVAASCVADVYADSERLPETQADVDGDGTVWALFFLPETDGPGEPIAVPVSKGVKIVWRATGDGPAAFTATGPSGQTTRPVWGPAEHGGSNWDHPGSEWGTGWEQPDAGCWTLHLRRGDLSATVAVTAEA